MGEEVNAEVGTVNFDIIVRLIHNPEPVMYSMQLLIENDGTINTVEELMDWAYTRFMAEMDSISSHVITIADNSHSHHMIIREHIQTMSLMAPDKMPEGFGDGS